MNTLLDRIDAKIEARHLLSHPFYRKWSEGTLPSSCLREYARQYFAFESAFPRVLSAIHARTEDAGARAALLANLWDEEHGEPNHAELWLRFAEGLGVPREDVRAATPNAAATTLVDCYRALAEHPRAGVAALYAYEAQLPKLAHAKIDGLKARYGIDDARTLAFFQVHGEIDVAHAASERAILEASEEEEHAEVEAAVDRALDAWWGFLDSVDSKPA